MGERPIETMAISEFKARCLAVIERVRQTRRSVLITRFGRPVAEVVPPSVPPTTEGWLGSMRGTVRIVGDIVGPTSNAEDWEALRP